MATVIVVGAGINGVTSAIELKKRGHNVVLVDPGPLPHPLAASTDISKAVRAAYGPDEDYTVLAERCIPLWREWNQKFGVDLYHETGVLFVCAAKTQPGDFEYESARVLEKQNHRIERFDPNTFRVSPKAVGSLPRSSNTRDRSALNCESVPNLSRWMKPTILSAESFWKVDNESAVRRW